MRNLLNFFKGLFIKNRPPQLSRVPVDSLVPGDVLAFTTATDPAQGIYELCEVKAVRNWKEIGAMLITLSTDVELLYVYGTFVTVVEKELSKHE